MATDAKAEWCNVLQLLRLEVRYHRYSGFSGGVDNTPDTQAGLVRDRQTIPTDFITYADLTPKKFRHKPPVFYPTVD